MVSVSLAKITRPELKKGILQRKRLFHSIDAGRRYPLVWISGPAGSGKTILVNSYLESRRLPCLWYQMDEGDSDLATFFYYLGLAGKKAAPRRAKPLPRFTPEYLLGVTTFAKRFFENLCGRLRIPSVIVFDNFQDVPASSPLHEALQSGFTALPQGVNVFIVSREAPPPAFARLRANNLVTEMEWKDLRLTESESSALVKLVANSKLSKSAYEKLYEMTAGWAAGVVLLARHSSVDNLVRRPTSETVGQVFDYFAGELFDYTEEKLQSFLLRTAFVPSMTPTMAMALSGDPKAEHVLNSLYRNNYFMDRRSGSILVFQFHPLFREFLLARAKEIYPAEDITELQRLAAGHLQQEERYEEAGDLLIDARDWQALARMALSQAALLAQQGRFGVLEGWLDSSPGEFVNNTPWLLYWKGICRLPFDQKQSRKYFEQAFNEFLGAADAAGTFLAWAGIVDAITYEFDNFKRLDPWISQLTALIDRFGAFPAEVIGARVSASMFMALVHRMPEHPEIGMWAMRALAHTCGNPEARAQTVLLYMYDRVGAGDVVGMERAISLLKELEGSVELPPLAQINAKLAKLLYCNFMGRSKECLQAVREGMEIARTTGVHVNDIILIGNGVISALAEEDLDQVEALLKEMSASLERARTWDLSFYYYLLAWRALLRNELLEARRQIDTAVTLTKQVGVPFSIASSCLLQAYIRHALGEDEKALSCVARVEVMAHSRKSAFFEIMCLVARAYINLQRDRAAAMSDFRSAMSMSREAGYLYTFNLWLKPVMARLCVAALEEGIEVNYVREVIRRHSLVAESPPLHIEAWPWPVKIYTLGRLSILKDDSPLHFSSRVQRKPMEMLKVLIALGGRGVREETISDILWPEAEGDSAHSNFTTTLSRLRKLFGNDKAFTFAQGRLSLELRYCWVDAWALKRALTNIYAEGISAKTADHMEKALALYHGQFLASDDEDWTLSLRERLRRRYLQGLLDLGQYWEAQEEWKKAIACYQKGLRVDDLAEEFYQRLMLCYRKLGLRAEALSTYERCRQALQRAFGVEPSPRTVSLYREISVAP